MLFYIVLYCIALHKVVVFELMLWLNYNRCCISNIIIYVDVVSMLFRNILLESILINESRH